MFTFTSAMTYQDIAKFKNNTLKYYLLFIRANRYNYPNLFNYLTIRNWIKKEKLINTNLFPLIDGAFYEDNNIYTYQEQRQIQQNDEAVARLMEMLVDENGGNG